MKLEVNEAVVRLLNYRGQKLKGVILQRTEENARVRAAISEACAILRKEVSG